MRGKSYVLLYLFAKEMACVHAKKNQQLLDLSAKDTTIEQDINMHVRGNVWN